MSERPDFSVSVSSTSNTIAPTGVAPFAITFDPAAPGLPTATVTVTSDDSDEGTYAFDVQSYGLPLMLINEIDADTLGTDNAEFIELYDGGSGNTPLDGLVVVLFNGNGDASYNAFDLDGFSTDANGYFVLGNAAVPNAQIIFDDGILQNGSDAVALYTGDATDFPNGTRVTTTNLIDAVVYGTSDPTDTGLLTLLNGGQQQLDESANGQSATDSLQRFPNGSGSQRNTDSFIVGAPSPGLANAATIEFGNATFTTPEEAGSSAVVTLTRSNGLGESTVEVRVTGGTATNADDYDGTGFPLTVTFADTETSKVIAIPLVDDSQVEGDETLELTLGNPTNAYLGAQGTATLTITDNDIPGFTLTESDAGTTVDESGTTDTFTVQLDSQPLTDVQLTVTSGDPAEATAAPTPLTFTPENWNQAQTVTVTGADDLLLDGDQTSTVTVAVNVEASDDAFDNLASQAVTVTTTDDDVASFSLTATDDTTVDESGTTDTFEVVLDRQPLTPVELTVTSGDPTEATAEPTTLTFTSENWNQAQTVTVTGVDDNLVDGEQISTVTVSVNAANSDAAFAIAPDQSITVTTTDNDTAGVTVTQTDESTVVTEGGATDTYEVVLDAQPEADVTLTLSPDAQLAVSAETLTFTAENWNLAQTVTVTAVDDNAVEGEHTGVISHSVSSADANYDGLSVPDITAAIADNDIADILVTESDDVTEVTEGGATDTYDLVLTSMPTSDVVITLTSDNETTLSTNTLTFTPEDWNVAQTVTVTATDDERVEGDHFSLITHQANSDDPNFNGALISDVAAIVNDNDRAGFSITESDGNTTVSETASEDTFELKLDSQPATDVVLTVTSGDPDEAIAALTALTFTPENWNVAQTVTVTGVDDVLVDGAQTSTISVSIDADASDDFFDALPTQTVTVTTEDDDAASFSIVESGDSTIVDESGTTDTFEVVLDRAPVSNVELVVESTDPTEATAAPTTLTFTPDDWDTPQTVTVTGADDAGVDGEQTSLITISVNAANSDAAFGELATQSVSVTTTDDDVAGVTLTQSNETTTAIEGGATDSYSLALDSQPTDTVTIALVPDAQVSLNQTSLTFTPENWNQAQTVTVTAINDDVVEGPHTGAIAHSISSNDAVYDGLALPEVTVDITDNDSIGITVNESNGVTNISEAGVTDGYTLVLNSQPTADVKVTLTADDQATLSKSTVTFTPTNWNQPQTITVAAVDDDLAEGPHTSTITHTVTSADPDYSALTLPDVTANITDNDTADITLTQSNGTTLITEDGATDGYSVVLNSQPTADVTLTLTSDDQTSLSQNTLTFTPTNWNQAQTVSVAAIDDAQVEGPHSGFISHTVTSDDAQYAALTVDEVEASITDNDKAGFTLSQSTATVSEDGTVSETVLLTLDGEPLSPVVLKIESANPDEVTTDVTSVTLDSANWETGVPVQILGVSDVVVDGDQTTALTVSVDDANSNDAFDALADQEIVVTTLDNSTAEAVLSDTTATVSEAGATDTYTIALSSRPAAAVTFTFDGGDQLQTPEPITFTPENWDVAQTVTIAAINDDAFEEDHLGTLTPSVSSEDPNFDGITVAPITVSIDDNDRPTNLIFTFDQYVTFQAIDEGIFPSFDEELYLLANPDVAVGIANGEVASAAQHYELYGQAEGRSLLPLELEIGSLNMADFFDETYYLNQYQDVAEGVRQGNVANGFEHFLRYGIAEGRNPSRYYNEELYLAINSDVAEAVQNGDRPSGLSHYLQFGHLENRLASEIFNAEDYLVNHPDVAAGIENGEWSSAFEHFLEAGAQESRLPVLLYEESTYLAENDDVAAAVANNQYPSGFEHYVTFGQGERRDPSVSFDESAYLAANPDVAEAVLAGFHSSGMEHYFRYGRAENRALD